MISRGRRTAIGPTLLLAVAWLADLPALGAGEQADGVVVVTGDPAQCARPGTAQLWAITSGGERPPSGPRETMMVADQVAPDGTPLAVHITFIGNERAFLRTMRMALVCFTGMVLAFALNSEASIFKMVESAYKVTLVAAFIPLVAGLYWTRATSQGALAAIGAGLVTWIWLELFGSDNDVCPPQLVGFLMAGAGMLG